MPSTALPRLLPLLALLVLPVSLRAQQSDTTRKAVERDEIVVTAERGPGRASDASAAVRSIGRADIESRAATDLTTILRDVPGVQIDPVVGSGSGVVLQGLGSERVLVLLDGAPLTGRISGQFDITRVSPSQLERVEIVEGPQSTLYGSAALGGVVNLLTRRSEGRRIELGANPAERFVHVERRAIAAPLVEHVAGDRRQPRPFRRVGRGADRHHRKHRDERNLVVLDSPGADAVRERAAADLRKREELLRTERRRPAAIGGHQETVTGREPVSASARRPRGTTLRTMRAAGRKYCTAAARSRSAVAER